MKTIKLCYLLFAITGLLYGCYDFNTAYVKFDDLAKDPLAFQKMVGTYVFKPDAHQAERLNIKATDSIVLKIISCSVDTADSAKRSFIGKYEIDKMVLGMNIDHRGVFSSTWKIKFNKKGGSNTVRFDQNLTNNQDMSFQLEHVPDQDALHIIGYTSDPKYEVIQIVDFKKVR